MTTCETDHPNVCVSLQDAYNCTVIENEFGIILDNDYPIRIGGPQIPDPGGEELFTIGHDTTVPTDPRNNYFAVRRENDNPNGTNGVIYGLGAPEPTAGTNIMSFGGEHNPGVDNSVNFANSEGLYLVNVGNSPYVPSVGTTAPRQNTNTVNRTYPNVYEIVGNVGLNMDIDAVIAPATVTFTILTLPTVLLISPIYYSVELVLLGVSNNPSNVVARLEYKASLSYGAALPQNQIQFVTSSINGWGPDVVTISISGTNMIGTFDFSSSVGPLMGSNRIFNWTWSAKFMELQTV